MIEANRKGEHSNINARNRWIHSLMQMRWGERKISRELHLKIEIKKVLGWEQEESQRQKYKREKDAIRFI